jgi:hypothetical protein
MEDIRNLRHCALDHDAWQDAIAMKCSISSAAATAMDAVIRRELRGSGLSADDITHICVKLRKQAGDLAMSIQSTSSDVGMHVEVISQPGSMLMLRLCQGKKSRAVMTITSDHYQKMRHLFNNASQGSSTKSSGAAMAAMSISNTDEDEDFNCALFVCLARYEAIGGAGFQAALPAKVFELLRKEFGVEFEMFASPFNCHFGAGQYCSAFGDTDSPFGSRGNFFKFVEHDPPLEGSFEINPPFMREVRLNCSVTGV